MMSSDANIREYYAARASEYDRVYEKPERQLDIRLLQERIPKDFVGSRVLDVAAGTGFWTTCFAEVASEIVLLDASGETLEIAKRRLPADKVRFVVGDAYALPPELGTFDAAFVGFWFSHVPKSRRRGFLQGLSARVRRGGKVVLVDNRYVEGSNHPISNVDDEGNTYQTRRLSNGSGYHVLKNFPSREELEEIVGDFSTATRYWELEYYWVLTVEAA